LPLELSPDLQCCDRFGRLGATGGPLQPAPRGSGGAVSVQNSNASVAFGVGGVRNVRLPTYMSTTVGGGQLQLPSASSLTDMSRSALTWEVTASGRATLWRSRRGVDLGLVGDVTVPLGSQAPSGPHNPVLPGLAIWFGLAVGF
jgi:hypothetical protein